MKLKLFLFALALLILGGIAQWSLKQSSATSTYPQWAKSTNAQFKSSVLLDKTRPLHATHFRTHTGENFSVNDFKGAWNLVFFGFTHCPDICPSTLHILKQAKDTLEKKGIWQNFNVYMVSVDPERDTIEKLAQYMPFFDTSFTGLRADEESTFAFAKQLGVLFKKQPAENSNRMQYNVDHSSAIIIVGPNTQMAGLISAPHSVQDITHDLSVLASATQQLAAPLSKTKDKKSLTIKHAEQKHPVTLEIQNPWVRAAPPNSSAMAAYASLVNHSDKDIIITHLESPDFDEVMIHETVFENGIAKMQHLNPLKIPANTEVLLAPKGKHFMLIDPDKPLPKGSVTHISLHDQNGTIYTKEFPVITPTSPTQ